MDGMDGMDGMGEVGMGFDERTIGDGSRYLVCLPIPNDLLQTLCNFKCKLLQPFFPLCGIKIPDFPPIFPINREAQIKLSFNIQHCSVDNLYIVIYCYIEFILFSMFIFDNKCHNERS